MLAPLSSVVRTYNMFYVATLPPPTIRPFYKIEGHPSILHSKVSVYMHLLLLYKDHPHERKKKEISPPMKIKNKIRPAAIYTHNIDIIIYIIWDFVYKYYRFNVAFKKYTRRKKRWWFSILKITNCILFSEI